MTFKTLLGLLTLSSFVACANAAQDRTYAVSAQLEHHGTIFGTPQLVVKEGAPAVAELSGADGYKLSMRVQGLPTGKLQVAADLSSSYGSMTPTLVVDAGIPASVQVGDLELKITVEQRSR